MEGEPPGLPCKGRGEVDVAVVVEWGGGCEPRRALTKRKNELPYSTPDGRTGGPDFGERS